MRSIFFILFIFLFACNSQEELKTLDFGPFTAVVPSAWEKLEVKGIDSYVGGVTDKIDTLTYDYGWYSSSFSYLEGSEVLSASGMIDGLRAYATKPVKAGEGLVGIHIPKVNSKDKFTFYGNNLKDENTAMAIFKSLRFGQSSNGLTDFDETSFKISEFTTPLSIINKWCASCHKIDFKLVGPALNDMTLSTFENLFDNSSENHFSKQSNSAQPIKFHGGIKLSESEIAGLKEYFFE